MPVRPYQAEMIDGASAAFASGARAVLIQAPTGSGKSHITADIIHRATAKGRRVLCLSHLDALRADLSGRLSRTGVAHSVLAADAPNDATAPVQVASMQTLHARPDCRPAADLLIVDECRRAAAPTVREILAAYPAAHLLGTDATPERGDGTPLGDIFDAMVCGPSVRWLTSAGYLVPAAVLSPPVLVEGALAMDPVDAFVKHAHDRRAIFFCRDVEEARDVAHRLPVHAQVITGETRREVREEARRLLAAGELRAIVNVSVYRDGADLPSADCIVLAQTLGVTSAYLQAVGRGLRISPETGKRDCLVLDLTGAAIVHGLPDDDRVWSLTGAAVARVGSDLKIPLVRCGECFAVMHAGPVACPRCGASLKGRKVKRRATRIERQELARLDERPQEVRDAIAIRGIENRLRSSGRFSEAQIPRIAASIFAKKRGRAA
ncbi:MAG TPA: DEAD/DEAH box helicase family protein [Polyangiaceae bacterium]